MCQGTKTNEVRTEVGCTRTHGPTSTITLSEGSQLETMWGKTALSWNVQNRQMEKQEAGQWLPVLGRGVEWLQVGTRDLPRMRKCSKASRGVVVQLRKFTKSLDCTL